MSVAPLLIRCELAAPVAGPEPYVHLDGLIAWAQIMLRGPTSQAVGHVSSDDLVPVRLPLERQDGVWAASALWPLDCAPVGVGAWRMRPATEYAHLTSARQIAVAHGRLRARDERLTLYPQRTWQARCVAAGKAGPADAAREVRKLLKQVTAIGKKRSQGYGRVITWHVDRDDRGADWSDWGDGVARAPIPHPDGVPQGVEPPYWYRPWHRPAISPGEAL